MNVFTNIQRGQSNVVEDKSGPSDHCGIPPFLAGYSYSPQEAREARDAGRLLTIRLETNSSCNLSCGYCHLESGAAAGSLDKAVDYGHLAETVLQASRLGARSAAIEGGEPTLYPRFIELVTLIDDVGMIPVVSTNMTRITPGIAGFLFEKNASVMGKMDSMNGPTQDMVSGRPGAFKAMKAGLRNLVQAGFAQKGPDSAALRLGLSCVSSRLNLHELADIWRYCRQSNIFPHVKALTEDGRPKRELADQCIGMDEIKAYKLELLEIDRTEYGYDWLPYSPRPGSGCMQYICSMYVTVKGDVRPCAATKLDESSALRGQRGYLHNLRRTTLAEIYRSPLFEYVRNIDHHLEGFCGRCDHNSECMGCRGNAFAAATSDGKDVFEALRSECLQCFKGADRTDRGHGPLERTRTC